MHKHVFTLGLISASLCVMPAMAAWNGPTKTTTQDAYTSSARTTKATEHCSDCCKTDCWLPAGTYYSSTGTFSHTCTNEPTSGPTGCSTKNLGNQCVDLSETGTTYGYLGWTSDSSDNWAWMYPGMSNPTSSPGAYGTWAVQFTYGQARGMVACDTTASATVPTAQTAGGYCYCGLSSVGTWSGTVFQFYGGMGDSQTCMLNCPNACAINFRDNGNSLRTNLYNKI